MTRRFILCLLAIVAITPVLNLTSHAQPPLQTLHNHVRPIVSSGQAALVGSLPSGQRMHLSIMLPLRNQDQLDSLVSRLYDPSSPDYRQFLSVAQFTDQFGPTAESYQAVVDFAKASGFTVENAPPNRLIVPISGSAEQINKAFHVSMNFYRHPTENRNFYSPDREPSVNLSVPLWHIAGLDNYSIPRPAYQKADAISFGTSNTTGSGPGGSFLGSDRRAAYYGGTKLTGSGQVVGLMQFDGYDLSDLQTYFTNAGQPLNVPIVNVLVGGASNGSDGDDTEQIIDMVEALSMAPGLTELRVYIAPYSTLPIFGGDGDVLIFNEMAFENLAKQLSSSWNWSPDDPTKDDPFFLEFKAQGQTFFVASGDSGAWPGAPYFYPEEDANVTAVGGTDLTTNGAGGAWESEIAWGGVNSTCNGGGGSGGGVSPDKLLIPSYQQLAGVINSSNKGSTTYRNAPDVAAEANCDNYFCANGSCTDGLLGGTSLAAPTWAGYMALVNQQALEGGKSTAGFLNPTIYSIGIGPSYDTDFHDIIVGDNFNGTSPTLYSAVTGYDLVTGWGSPNGQNLINALSGVTAGNCHVTYTVENAQPGIYNGLTVDINIQNTGTTAIYPWTLSWTFPGNQQIDYAWNVTESQSGEKVSMASVASWESIPAGSTLSGAVGFNGIFTGANSIPTTFYLNGLPCN